MGINWTTLKLSTTVIKIPKLEIKKASLGQQNERKVLLCLCVCLHAVAN